jgi:hypothetical protein
VQIRSEDEMIFYNYNLVDEDDLVFMSTSVDEPNPMIDKEFWDRFMEGDCYMQYLGETEEEEEE